MKLAPKNIAELKTALTQASQENQKIGFIHLRHLSRIVEHTPEDMTVTVELGITLGQLQEKLAIHRQWLPIDPPNPNTTSLETILSENLSGPRRYGYGTIREYVLGLSIALSDGRIVKSGGKVVKNVAGYDLAKLFIGSKGTLGIMVEATFKIRPQPEAEAFVEAQFRNAAEAETAVSGITSSSLVPVVFDLHSLKEEELGPSRSLAVVLGFAGSKEEVDWQVSQAAELGFTSSSNLDYERTFWDRIERKKLKSGSFLPSRLFEFISHIAGPYIARAGNGIIYYSEGPDFSKANLPINLMKRVKQIFDPKHLLPDFFT